MKKTWREKKNPRNWKKRLWGRKKMRVVHLPNDLMGRQKKRRQKSILVLAINIYVSITCFLIVLRLRLLCHDHVLKFLSNVFSDIRHGLCSLWQCTSPWLQKALWITWKFFISGQILIFFTTHYRNSTKKPICRWLQQAVSTVLAMR